jgi:hypothetical protein
MTSATLVARLRLLGTGLRDRINPVPETVSQETVFPPRTPFFQRLMSLGEPPASPLPPPHDHWPGAGP